MRVGYLGQLFKLFFDIDKLFTKEISYGLGDAMALATMAILTARI